MHGTDALLDRVVEVCPQQVLALTSGDTASVPEVARVLSTDPALAAAVLSVANGAASGSVAHRLAKEIGQRFLERNSLPDTVCAAVGSDLTVSDGRDALAKITLIARQAPRFARLFQADARTSHGRTRHARRARNVDGARVRDLCKTARAVDALR